MQPEVLDFVERIKHLSLEIAEEITESPLKIATAISKEWTDMREWILPLQPVGYLPVRKKDLF